MTDALNNSRESSHSAVLTAREGGRALRPCLTRVRRSADVQIVAILRSLDDLSVSAARTTGKANGRRRGERRVRFIGVVVGESWGDFKLWQNIVGEKCVVLFSRLHIDPLASCLGNFEESPSVMNFF